MPKLDKPEQKSSHKAFPELAEGTRKHKDAKFWLYQVKREFDQRSRIFTLINADLTGFFKQIRKISVEIVSGLDAFPAKVGRAEIL